MIRTRTKNRNSADIWPGFVDAISTLLLVLIFLLGLFLFSESVLSKLLSNKEDVLQGLNSQINQLSELLSLERRENRDLSDTISQLNRQLTQANNEADLFGVESKDLQDKNILSLSNFTYRVFNQIKIIDSNNDKDNNYIPGYLR